MSNIKNIGVMCASSELCDPSFHSQASEVGRILAKNGYSIIYGGGSRGSMGAMANGALETGGTVIGYMPKFMVDIEWQHPKLSQLVLTQTMSERKDLMIENSHAIVFLPGGSGTLEEFFDALTAKRLGIFTGPLILIDHRDFFKPLNQLLISMIDEKFLNPIHEKMWSTISDPSELISAICHAYPWKSDSIRNAGAFKN